jgi:hypothetical protein
VKVHQDYRVNEENDMTTETLSKTPSSKRQALTKQAAKVATYYKPSTWKEKGIWWTAGLFLITYLIVVIILGIYWSRSPGMYDVREQALSLVKSNPPELVTGNATTATAIRIGETLLDKPGGYLTNDVSPPGLYLDNMPNWEFGALTAWRDLLNALRNDFSRAQSQSVENKDLEIAQPQSNYQSDSWLLPSTSRSIAPASTPSIVTTRALRHQCDRCPVLRPRRQSDHLSRSGRKAPRQPGAAPVLCGRSGPSRDRPGRRSQRRQSTPVPTQTQTKTPWMQIDDIFFEARGYTWALLHALQAMEIDFASVLEDKNATVSLEQITRELRNTQNTIWSPLILNGTGFGPMANHSLVMASPISRGSMPRSPICGSAAQERNLLKDGVKPGRASIH